ncbi:MAG: hypothetical protein AAFY29_19795 [Pseudomonadota bacterium]
MLAPAPATAAQTFTGSIAIGETASYSFDYVAGERIIATLVDTADNDFTPTLELFAPGGTRLANIARSDSASVNLIAETTGTFSIRVSDDARDTSGDFRLDVSELPGSNDGGTLNNGSVVTESLALGEVRAYQFSADDGDLVIATLNDALQSGSLRPKLELYSPGGALLSSTAGESTAAARLRVEETGIFTLVVSDDGYDVAGDLRLDLSIVAGVNDGGALNPGTTVTDSVLRGEVIGYQFDAVAGDHLVATLNDTQLSASFDPYLLVFAPDGDVLVDTSKATTAWANLPLEENGTYSLLVADTGFDAPGDFRLDVSLARGTNDGGVIGDGSVINDSLLLGEHIVYRFNATAGQRIIATMADTQSDPGFQSSLELYAPDGTRLSRNTADGTAHADLIAAQTGSFGVIVAEENYDFSGSFQLDLSVGAAPAPIVGGQAQAINGTANIGETDSFSVQALAGDRLVVTLVDNTNPGSTASSVLLEVFAPDTSLFASDSDATSAFINITATQSGTYDIDVSELNRDTAINYRLDITRVRGANDGGTLTNGTPVSGSLLRGEVLAYQFEAAAGDRIVGTLADNTNPFSSASSAYLELYAPDGTRLANSTDLTTAVVSLVTDQTGMFTFLVSEGSYDSAIDYRFDFSRVPEVNDGGALTSGVPVVGSLLLGEVLAYQLDVAAGDRIVATLADNTNPFSSGSSAYLELYAPDGRRLATSTDLTTAFINLSVDETGTFTFLVSEGSYDSAIDFRLDVSRVPHVNDGGKLSNGVPVVNSLLRGEVLAYQLDMAAGDRIVATLADNTNPFSSGSSAYLELYAPDGRRLAVSTDLTTAFINLTVDQTGTFILLVAEGDYDAAINFRLDVSRVPQVNDGGTMTNGVAVVDSLLLGEVLAYQFEAAAGDRIVATLADNSNPGLSTSSTYLELYAPDGTRLAASGDTSTAFINLAVEQTGTFTLLAAEDGYDAAISFRLDLSRVPQVNDGGTVSSGVPVVDSLLLGEVLAYQFDVAAGDRITANLADTSSPGLSTSFAYLELYSPQGVRLFTSSDATAAVIDAFAGQGGTFTLLVAEQSYNSTMDFRLDLTLTPADDGGSLVSGQSSINTVLTGEVAVYRFVASAGDRVFALLRETLNSFAHSPRLIIAAPDGSFIVDETSSTLVGSGFIAPRTGTYVILVAENGFDTGYQYELSLALGDDGLDDISLTDGMVVTGPLIAGDVLTYRFTAVQGDSIVATLTETGSAVGASPRLQLITPGGTTINNTSTLYPTLSSPNHVHLTTTESGVYTLLASENGLNTSFSFRLEFARIPGASDGGEIVNGTPRTGTLTSGELVAYQFLASSGDTVTASLSDVGGSLSFTPFLELYDPSGSLVVLDADAVNATLTVPLTESGTYTLMAASLVNFGYGGSGDYSLTISGATPPDEDGDGVTDRNDNCPTISNSSQQNTDGDSLGNACDPDDDNDGLTDSEENALGTNPLIVDTDGDGFSDREEVDFGTDPLSADSIPVNGLPIWLLYEAVSE